MVKRLAMFAAVLAVACAPAVPGDAPRHPVFFLLVENDRWALETVYHNCNGMWQRVGDVEGEQKHTFILPVCESNRIGAKALASGAWDASDEFQVQAGDAVQYTLTENMPPMPWVKAAP